MPKNGTSAPPERLSRYATCGFSTPAEQKTCPVWDSRSTMFARASREKLIESQDLPPPILPIARRPGGKP
jgi:hypothetical protein